MTDNQTREESLLMPAVLGCDPKDRESRLHSDPPVISLVGGGGKTTCILTLAKECLSDGVGAVVATTTHMQMPFDRYLLQSEDMEALHDLMRREGQVWLGRRLEQTEATVMHKSKALALSFISRVCRESNAPVLIEADGARCLPCKAPGDKEPVLVPETTHLVSVYGLDALGGRIRDCCFRPELVCDITGKSEEARIEEEDLIRLALSTQGGRKGLTQDMHHIVVLNKADDAARTEQARRIAAQLTDSGAERVLITCGLHRGI